MKAHKPSNVKSHNLKILRETLQQETSFSSRELSDVTGLSVVSINKLLAELKETGEVIEVAETGVTGGRRAAVYQYNPNFKQMFILQISEENSTIVGKLFVSNLLGETVEKKTLETQELTFEKLKLILQQMLEKYPATQLLVFGIPGEELEGKFQIMDFAPWYNLEFRQLIQEAFSLDVIIENDINAATLGYSLQQLEGEILVSLYYPEQSPPGAGIVFNGEIFRGRHGLSGEVKHLPLEHQMTFPKELSALEKQVEEVLQTIISMYDPYQIVLYTTISSFSTETLQMICERLSKVFPYFTLPEIHLADTFQKDYFNGLVHLGLKNLAAK
ncbi:hypothetical protein GCM10025886_15580 [Tetragenococcus halophilus subsp. flandriensis]|nr:hypothetical protein GCM10025886_15580 [Tetragenococcus halophilus subsp. flandriensis]